MRSGQMAIMSLPLANEQLGHRRAICPKAGLPQSGIQAVKTV
jgi:hypothetical protein